MEGHSRSWRVMKCQGMSRNVIEGHRRSFPIIRLSFQVRKVMGGIVQSAMLVCAVSYVGVCAVSYIGGGP